MKRYGDIIFGVFFVGIFLLGMADALLSIIDDHKRWYPPPPPICGRYITVLVHQTDGKIGAWKEMLTNDFTFKCKDGTEVRLIVDEVKPPGFGDH